MNRTMSRFLSCGVFAVIFLAVDLGATLPGDSPQSPAAQSALANYARAVSEAKRTYDASVAKSAAEATHSLQSAMNAAMARHDLAEANRIDASIRSFKQPSPVPQLSLQEELTLKLQDSTWQKVEADGSVTTFRLDRDGMIHFGKTTLNDVGRWTGITENAICLFYGNNSIEVWKVNSDLSSFQELGGTHLSVQDKVSGRRLATP